jgi:hypothetical protein
VKQNVLFHDSIYDALAADVSAIGGIKKVSGQLWPTLDSAAAAARLRGGLNPEHAQKLCLEEVMAIKRMARDAGSYATITYEGQQLGFESTWISAEDARAELQRKFVESVAQLEQIKRALQR